MNGVKCAVNGDECAVSVDDCAVKGSNLQDNYK